MDLDNMMITPVMYQDIPSSFMMRPMPMMGMYGGMMPTYGVAPMQPKHADDTFEKIQAKDKETKHTMRNAGIALTVLTAIGLLFGKKLNIKTPALFSRIRNAFSTGYTSAKSGAKTAYNWTLNQCRAGWNWVSGLFKKSTP